MKLSIDNIDIDVNEGSSILDAARSAGIYIPVICSHPDLPNFHDVELAEFVYRGNEKIENDPGANINSVKGCGICIVFDENANKPIPSCSTIAMDGMKISTRNEIALKRRQDNLMKIFANHPHSCLTCAQREGCIPMSDVCPGSVIMSERCCALLGRCELQKIADYVGIPSQTQRYQYSNKPKVVESPLFNFNFNLCINCGRCVRMCQHVKGVFALGAVIHNGEFLVGTVNGPLLNEAECRFCGSCVEVCPTGAIMDKRSPRLKEMKDLVPCKTGCPAEVDIPQYLRLVSQGKNKDAAEIIAARLTFPSVLGKVCFHPCETNCRRNEIAATYKNAAKAINIRRVKDYALVHSLLDSPKKSNHKTGKKVAIAGSGPAGLTAAYLLSLKGHDVTVFEKEDNSGGMLRYGIPSYRLPKETLDLDFERLTQSGFKVEYNKTLGKDFTINILKESGFDSIFVAIGLNKSRNLNVTGESNESVHYGIELLNQYTKNLITDNYFESKSVVVIGGGNVATDVARTAVRLKATKVTMVCLEQYNEMPAYTNEIVEAEEEGVTIDNGWGITGIKEMSYGTKVIETKKCINVFDEKGKFSPVFDDNQTGILTCDAICVCIGQQSESIENDEILNNMFSRGLLKTNYDTLETNIKGVYAGGDIVSGPASVIDAVAAGRKAAKFIDLYLGGNGIIDDDSNLNNEYKMFIGRKPAFWKAERLEGAISESEMRKNSFLPIEITYSHEEAMMESSRCLQCDLRLKIKHNPLPPEKYLKFNSEIFGTIPQLEGVVQLLDKDKNIFAIKGSDNVRKTLYDLSETIKDASYFVYDLDPMFTKRESELIQQFLQKNGKLPDSGDDLDDLF